MYLLGKPDCLRGFTMMCKTITPTVKRQIGATTINIDSNVLFLENAPCPHSWAITQNPIAVVPEINA